MSLYLYLTLHLPQSFSGLVCCIEKANMSEVPSPADPFLHEKIGSRPVLLFDGVCNLCSASVQTVIRFDKQKKFLFASLQSDAARELLRDSGLREDHLDSVVLYYKGTFYTHSDAALHAARLMGGGWTLVYGFIVLPKFVRDGIYNWIARNRYRWFGKKDECWLPTPDLKARFL